MMLTGAWSLLLLLLSVVSGIIWYFLDDTTETLMKRIRRRWMNMITYNKQFKQKNHIITCTASSNIPRGTSGWPVIGETLEFIASGYSSRPVTFMEKRKSLYVPLSLPVHSFFFFFNLKKNRFPYYLF